MAVPSNLSLCVESSGPNLCAGAHLLPPLRRQSVEVVAQAPFHLSLARAIAGRPSLRCERSNRGPSLRPVAIWWHEDHSKALKQVEQEEVPTRKARSCVERERELLASACSKPLLRTMAWTMTMTTMLRTMTLEVNTILMTEAVLPVVVPVAVTTGAVAAQPDAVGCRCGTSPLRCPLATCGRRHTICFSPNSANLTSKTTARWRWK